MLNARGVEYLVVGAHPFAFHAKPRSGTAQDLADLDRADDLFD